MKLLAWAKTDVGKRRSRNEDHHLVDVALGLFAVADGMGGHQGGQTASRMAVAALRAEVAALADESSGPVFERRLTQPLGAQAIAQTVEFGVDEFGSTDPAATKFVPAIATLRKAAKLAANDIHEASHSNVELAGMGTTLTAVLIEPDPDASAPRLHGHVLHAGDSRLYRLQAGQLEQITSDHTWVADQIRSGSITPEEAKRSRLRHVITRSIGVDVFSYPDTLSIALQAGDVLLLCSDGLSNYVELPELTAIMAKIAPADLCEHLVNLANDRGGEDNITAVVVKVEQA